MVVHRGVQGKILSTLWILERNYANLDGMPQKCIKMLKNLYKIDFRDPELLVGGGPDLSWVAKSPQSGPAASVYFLEMF